MKRSFFYPGKNKGRKIEEKNKKPQPCTYLQVPRPHPPTTASLVIPYAHLTRHHPVNPPDEPPRSTASHALPQLAIQFRRVAARLAGRPKPSPLIMVPSVVPAVELGKVEEEIRDMKILNIDFFFFLCLSDVLIALLFQSFSFSFLSIEWIWG
jgi:hypothetical protein